VRAIDTGCAEWFVLTLHAVAGPIENYSPVTAERLKNPEPGNWMHYRRTYDGQGYSPLDQINTSNVKSLTPVWTFSTGVLEGHEAPPIINNGVMFVATPMGQVIAPGLVYVPANENFCGGFTGE
jgi:alcohol dehydrogenase (cytochrome c)